MKKKLLAILMAVLMVVMMLPAMAFAAEENYATLTIIHGVDPWSGPVEVVNVKYSFEEGATLFDLFNAAKTAGDIDGFVFGTNGYISSVTPKGGSEISMMEDYSYYWANYKNGDYAWNATDCTSGDVIKAGDCFQFSYEGYPTNAAPEDWKTVQQSLETAAKEAGDTTKSEAGTVTLSIVKGISFGTPNVITSKKYGFYEGATLGDLLKAAKEEGEIDGYNFTYGYLDSITPAKGAEAANKADYSTYWAVYKNGGYCQGLTDGTKEDLLTDGGSFEYAWEDYPAMVGLSKTDWNTLSGKAADGKEIAKGEKPKASEEKTDAAKLNQDTEKAFKTLYESLLEKGKNDSGFMALAAAAAGKSDYPDKVAIIANAKAAALNPKWSNIQTSIILLSAIGEDATDVDGSNLIDILAKTTGAIPSWVEGPSYTLYAYASNPAAFISGSSLNAPSKLIAGLKNAQNLDGGFGFGGSSSPDSTGAVLAALSGYVNNDDAKAMIPMAVAALKAMQNEDGGFGYGAGQETNIDSTAQAIIGLCAAGIDPAGSDFTKNGKNPITALLSFANKDNTDFETIKGMDMDYAREDGIRALAAYSGFRNTGKAYNIYTMAKAGLAKYTAPEVPKTSDNNNCLLYVVFAVMALAAMGSAVVVKKKSEE